MRFNMMLQNHKRRIWVLIVLLGMSPVANAVVLDRIAAIVNDDVVTQSEVASFGELNIHLSGLPYNDPLQNRIDHHLVLQQLKHQPPVQVDEQDIEEAVQAFTQQHGGAEKTEAFLNSVGMSDDDLKNEIREQISIRQFISFRFRPFVNITLEQAEKYYEETYRKKFEAEGKEAPSLADSFDVIQNELLQSQVQQRVQDWLKELRATANINVKE